MGWLLKAGAVALGLMLVSAAWPVSALLFLYAFGGPAFRALRWGGRRTPRHGGQHASAQPVSATPAARFRRRGSPLRTAVSLVFFVLAGVGVIEGGTLSPVVFGGIGLVMLIWGTPILSSSATVRPVGESVLLRSSLVPFRWFALAEVKLATRQVGKALGGIDERLLVTFGDGAMTVYVVLKSFSLTMRGAEDSIVTRLAVLARVTAPLGAYMMPLDSAAAIQRLSTARAGPVELDARGWPASLTATDYDILVVEAKRGGFLTAVGAYRNTTDTKASSGARLQVAGQVLARPTLLWEVFQELGKKAQWKRPDGLTTFLASVFATRGETVGERIAEAGVSRNQQEVVVQSLGTPPVQMSRAQLRAIARIYS